MADKSEKPESQARPLVIVDVPHAPILYFEGAPNFGTNAGVINVTLAANRHLLDGDKINVDVVAVAYLRCSIVAAQDLRRALDDALLLALPAEGRPTN